MKDVLFRCIIFAVLFSPVAIYGADEVSKGFTKPTELGFPDVAGSIVFSSDLMHYAFESRDENSRFDIIEDGEKITKINEGKNPVFSNNGKSFAYIGLKNNPEFMSTTNLYFVVMNDKIVSMDYSWIPYVIVSSDGGSYAFHGQKKERGGWDVVRDGKTMNTQGKEGLYPTFSPDGKHFAFFQSSGFDLMNNSGNFSLIFDGIEVYKGVGTPIDLKISPDNISYAIVVRDANKKKYIVHNGKQVGGVFDEIENVLFSPDGKRLAFGGRTGGGYDSRSVATIILDGQDLRGKYKSLDSGCMKFSPDSQHFSYNGIFENGDSSFSDLIVDGKIVSSGYAYANCMGYSDDGQSQAFSAHKQNVLSPSFVVQDGKELSYQYFGGLSYVPGTQDIVYFTKKDNKRFLVYKNKLISDGYEDTGIGGSWVASDGSMVAFVGENGGKEYVVRVKLQQNLLGDTAQNGQLLPSDELKVKKISVQIMRFLKSKSRGDEKRFQLLLEKTLDLLKGRISSTTDMKLKNKFVLLQSILSQYKK